MILTLLVLALVGVLSLWLMLDPLRRRTPADPDRPERERLEAERQHLYAELSRLEGGDPARPDLERRAALTLRALDALPPAVGANPQRTRLLALAGVGLAALVTVIGAVTFIPRWQLASLNEGEAKNVQAVLRLPGLRATAERSGQNADYMAWGKAAFDSGQYDQAVVAYGNALRLDARQPEALRRLGILLLTRGESGQAQPATPLSAEDAQRATLLIRTAAQLAPNEAESQLLLGFALARYAQDEAALAALERYRTLDPKGRDADELITAIRARQNETDPGLRVYAASCASCHGAEGRGGIGPSLRASTLTRESLRAVTLQGRGIMPAFPDLKGSDLDALLDLMERWQKEGQ